MPNTNENEKPGRPARRHAAEALGPSPLFVLADPQMGENIGAVARVMLNFGVTGLRLVRPRDGWPNEKAGAMAAGAAPVLDNVTVHQTVNDAIADCQFVAATTARRREMMTPVVAPKEAAATLRAQVEAGRKCAMLFGGERNGLSSEDVARADVIVSVPINPAFASLNLAQAACVVAYEWAQSDNTIAELADPERTPAARETVEGLIDHLQGELDKLGYFFPEEKKSLMQRNLRVALTQAAFTRAEVHSLRGAIKALVEGRDRR